MRLVLKLAPLLTAALACASAIAADQTETVSVRLTNFRFNPDAITLHHGRAYVLHLSNAADGGHDFVAKNFFAAAGVEGRGPVRHGEVELRGGEAVDVPLVAPAPGRYAVHCSHLMHSAFGMTTTVVVD